MDNYTQKQIRNVAVIAHVDHGKTTLVDAFLKQTDLFRDNQKEMDQEAILDSNDLEREKGITIVAKHASIFYKDHKINIIDTPGHADFGGEVERTLNMADGCLLIVDAQEGPMPQTKFVLRTALKTGLRPIVVINKIDKPYANSEKTLDAINDLFLELAENEDQLDFPVFYAIGRDGKAFAEMPTTDLATTPGNIAPLLDSIVEHIPFPTGDEEGPLQMLVTTLDFDPHLGRLLVGRIRRGKMKLKTNVVVVHGQEVGAEQDKGQIKAMFVREGLGYKAVEHAEVGEIIAVSGVESNAIGGTLCDPTNIDPLPIIELSPPAVRAKFEPNSSPFMGKEGKFVSAKQLQQRLDKEKQTNIGLDIEKSDGGGYLVAGRGELQLSVLIEELRREGYEFQVRRPEVILREENGVKLEPKEEVMIDAPTEHQGGLITAISERKGQIVDMQVENGQVRITSHILTRNLLGLRNELITISKGTVVMSNYIMEYVPFDTTQVEIYRRGALLASHPGVSTAYSLNSVQERGDLFIGSGVNVYEGMIIGLNKYEQDMDVNVAKEREKTSVRRNQAEITQVALKTIKEVSIEFALVFLNEDEMLEVTPENLRLRKVFLLKSDRARAKRGGAVDYSKV